MVARRGLLGQSAPGLDQKTLQNLHLAVATLRFFVYDSNVMNFLPPHVSCEGVLTTLACVSAVLTMVCKCLKGLRKAVLELQKLVACLTFEKSYL